MKIGVIIGRYQAPQLTEGHKHVIDTAAEENDMIIIIAGDNTKKFTKIYPIPILYRLGMINDYCLEKGYNFHLERLLDYRLDEVWSEKVDKKIAKHISEGDEVTLYGSRDCFHNGYTTKKYPFREVVEIPGISATLVREKAAQEINYTPAWAEGVIHAVNNQYPVSYQVVDIAIIKTSSQNNEVEVLLGRKHNETQIRFPGGFTDVTDNSLEDAASREAHEECGEGIELSPMKYITSRRVDDWRYRRETNKIMTAFYVCHYIFGQVKGSDDLAEVNWFNLKTVNPEDLVHEHRVLLEKLLEYVNSDNFINSPKVNVLADGSH